MKTPDISVCIPAYEMGGNGGKFLSKSFGHLASQDFNNFEVIVSDQSQNSDIHELCQSWKKELNIKYIRNSQGARQSSSNCNHAMNAAQGKVVKILFQDDYLCERHALSTINGAFQNAGADWLLCGSGITHDGLELKKPMIPRLSAKLHFGKNTVSSPSVLAVKRDCPLRFDENLVWLMDVEMYWRLWQNLGEPIIAPDALVANYIHADQVSASVDRSLMQRELDYVWKKHGRGSPLSGRVEYIKRKAKLSLEGSQLFTRVRKGK